MTSKTKIGKNISYIFIFIGAIFTIGLFGTNVQGQGIGLLTGFVTAESGTSYDVEFCIREGYTDASGTSYEFTGSIGCSIGSDFSMSIDPTSSLAVRGDEKFINISLADSSHFVSLSALGIPSNTTTLFSPMGCTPNCNSNLTINTTNSTPEGIHLINIAGRSGAFQKTSIYNLTILPSNVSLTCGNMICNYPETQSTCSADCNTTAAIDPSTVASGQTVDVAIEFHDFRYQAGGKVRIDLTINPEGTKWLPVNGCFFGGKKMGSAPGLDGTIQWPAGTVSESGHFKIATTCTLPASIAFGGHTLLAVPSIF